MPKITPADLQPGMHVWDDESRYPYELRVARPIQTVTHTLGAGVAYGFGAEDRIAATRPIEVTTPPPAVFMSWDADSQTWAVLVSTAEGAGQSRVNIALNDAELFDGITDPDEITSA